MATILIVDDERPLRELLVTMFEQNGHRVVEARNGLQALELVGAERPDAIVSDVMMPLMSGIELCQRVKQDDATRHLPVVLMSASDEQPTRGAGADAFLSKPFDVDVLEEILARLLGRPE